MTSDVIFVYPDTSVIEVANILFKNRFHGVPVVEKNKVVGIITESDFFLKNFDDLYLPTYLKFIQENKSAEGLSTEVKEKINKLVDMKAKDLMTSDCLTISPEMEVADLMEIVKKNNYFTLPVTDDDKNILGIVTLADVLGTVRESSREMKTANLENKTREIDKLARSTYVTLRQKMVLINRKKIQTWKGMTLVSLITAMLALTLWLINTGSQTSCNFDERSIVPIDCQAFTYTDWSTCRSDGTQIREVLERQPKNCEGGMPILIQNCQ